MGEERGGGSGGVRVCGGKGLSGGDVEGVVVGGEDAAEELAVAELVGERTECALAALAGALLLDEGRYDGGRGGDGGGGRGKNPRH